jgi:branched-subunit amino acid aminotransferase/4-amino-4-deoxychorismate lyase
VRKPDPAFGCRLDGRRVALDEARLRVDDPALMAGWGLFETLAVDRGRVLELEAHLERLRNGLQQLGLAAVDTLALRQILVESANELPYARGWLRLVVSGAGRSIVYGGQIDPGEQGRPASAILLPWRRNRRAALRGVKSLSYASNLRGLAFAEARAADEGIWLNDRGRLAEGCTSNLFVVHGRKLFTPGEGEGILPGTLRALVLRASRGLGVPTHEGRLRLRRLERAQEAFLTSAVRGLRPLLRFEGRPVGSGATGPITRRLQAELRRQRGLAREESSA